MNLVIIAALSTVVYLVSSRFCPTRVQRVEQPYATGSENTDAMLNGIAANLDALLKLNDAIPDAELSRQLDRMEKAGRGIVQAVEQKPDKARTVDRFARYYLPEVVKIMSAYAQMEKGGITGENAAQIFSEVRRPTLAPWPPHLKTSWTPCIPQRQWIFRPTSKCLKTSCAVRI